MNDRSKQLILMLEKHLQEQTPLEEMENWLRKTYRSIRSPFKEHFHKPSNQLEIYVVSVILSIKDDVLRHNFSPSIMEWYWGYIEDNLNLLKGNKIHKQTVFVTEPSIDKPLFKEDNILSTFPKVEELVSKLATDKINASQLHFYISSIKIEEKPLSSQTTRDILMNEILNLFECYQNLVLAPRNQVPTYNRDTDNILHQLKALVQCYKGEQSYSLSLVFEGLDKFLITIVL